MGRPFQVIIDKERCKGCGLCINFCPLNLLVISNEINKRGFHYATVRDNNRCKGCAQCAIICPDVAIEIYR
ncbi:MAG: 4Fe-4S binding protein [bacterium]|nr:4Fe-4S binding protein [bacterium]